MHLKPTYFIEKHFTAYFNQDSSIPNEYFKNSRRSLLNSLSQLEKKAIEKSLDDKFTKVISSPIKEFTDSEENPSFRELIYIKTYTKEILAVLKTDIVGIKLERELIDSLIYMNLNSYSFYTYIALKIRQHAQMKSSYEDQLDVLKLFQKIINQSQVKPECQYENGSECIKTQLSKWIEAEINYFSDKGKSESKLDPTKRLDIEPPLADKIQFNISVSQLAYGMSLLAKSNIIQVKSTSDLLDFASKNLTTKSRKNITTTSLRNKFYSNEASTVEYITNIMEELIEIAEDDMTKI